MITTTVRICRFAAVLGLLIGSLQTLSRAQIAIQAETLHPVSGPAITDGLVLIRDGKILAIGRAADMQIPAGFQLMKAKVVTPGLVDARSTVGLAGIYNRNQDQDQVERSAAIQPELRALDAYNHQEKLVTWLREFGVTTVNTGHAPATLVPGQAMVVKTKDAPLAETVLKANSMILATLSDAARGGDGKSPGTRAKMMSLLRQSLVDAGDYARKQEDEDETKRPARDLSKEALALVLAGKVPLTITAHRERDIMSALRLAKEFELKIILDGATEIEACLDAVKAAAVPVILRPTMSRTSGEEENGSFETAAKLEAAGILFAIKSGYESYVPKTRVILFEAGIAAANDLGFDAALRAITLNAAKILGVDDRVGSLEVGKDADLVLFDGDPFEYTSHVIAVICDGAVVSRRQR